MSDGTGGEQRGADPARPATRDEAETLFGRFFPGPAPKDPRQAGRLEAIARAAERRAEREHQRAASLQQDRQPRIGTSVPQGLTSEDADRIVSAVHEQTDLLRELLDADVAIRDDSRATAQNSRTFAVAGTVIAFFTMVAAVVTVIISFTG